MDGSAREARLTADPIPVSVIVMTKNEADALPLCLPPLIAHFEEVFVVDSHSADGTAAIARPLGATVISFAWNGAYPKKKQWCADNVPARRDILFFCDADEIVTPDFIAELRAADLASRDGWFIQSAMVWNGRRLRYGMRNRKLALYDRRAFAFPAIDDATSPGGWEVEGHYQPQAVKDDVRIGTIRAPINHHASTAEWMARHERYALWEADMTRRNLWPRDPVRRREAAKRLLRKAGIIRPAIMFVYALIVKRGFLDGRAGLDYALKRAWYSYRIVHAVRGSTDGR